MNNILEKIRFNSAKKKTVDPFDLIREKQLRDFAKAFDDNNVNDAVVMQFHACLQDYGRRMFVILFKDLATWKEAYPTKGWDEMILESTNPTQQFHVFDKHHANTRYYIKMKENLMEVFLENYKTGKYSVEYFDSILFTLFNFSLHKFYDGMTVWQYCQSVKAFVQYHDFLDQNL